MTTDLEKQFFDTFGIEPKLVISLEDWENCKDLPRAEELFKHYPQITNSILLELICFNNRHYVTLEDLICPKNIETIKESVLKKYIQRNKEFVDNGYSGFCLDQVQALFEEGVR